MKNILKEPEIVLSGDEGIAQKKSIDRLPGYVRVRVYKINKKSVYHFFVTFDTLLGIAQRIDRKITRERLWRLLWNLSDLDLAWIPSTDELSCKGRISERL